MSEQKNAAVFVGGQMRTCPNKRLVLKEPSMTKVVHMPVLYLNE